MWRLWGSAQMQRHVSMGGQPNVVHTQGRIFDLGGFHNNPVTRQLWATHGPLLSFLRNDQITVQWAVPMELCRAHVRVKGRNSSRVGTQKEHICKAKATWSFVTIYHHATTHHIPSHDNKQPHTRNRVHMFSRFEKFHTKSV